MGSIGNLLDLMKASEAMDQQEQGKALPAEQTWKLAAQDEAMNQLKRMIELKTKGFGGQGIDTGPLAQFYPESVSAWSAEREGLPPESQSDRARLKQAGLWFTNPIRKEVTGSQASAQELKNFIQPMVPGMGDNDNVWLGKAMESAQALGGQRKSLIKELMNQQQRAPDFDYDAYINDIKQQLYGK